MGSVQIRWKTLKMEAWRDKKRDNKKRDKKRERAYQPSTKNIDEQQVEYYLEIRPDPLEDPEDGSLEYHARQTTINGNSATSKGLCPREKFFIAKFLYVILA